MPRRLPPIPPWSGKAPFRYHIRIGASSCWVAGGPDDQKMFHVEHSASRSAKNVPRGTFSFYLIFTPVFSSVKFHIQGHNVSLVLPLCRLQNRQSLKSPRQLPSPTKKEA